MVDYHIFWFAGIESHHKILDNQYRQSKRSIRRLLSTQITIDLTVQVDILDEIYMVSPGHLEIEHGAASEFGPGQNRPPFWGGGSSHNLARFL